MKHHHNFEFSPKFLIIILTIACIVLLSVSVVSKKSVSPIRNIATIFIIPMQNGINICGDWVADRFNTLESIQELQAEKADLEKKVEELSENVNSLKKDQRELRELRKLLSINEEYSDYSKVGAQVISSGSGNWYENFIINKGERDGISVNMNVLAESGLVGIVTEVGSNYARVQSILDDASKISVMSSVTMDKCIVQGNREQSLKDGDIDVIYIDKDAQISEGEELITSNISSKYLEGFRVGIIHDIKLDSSTLTKSAKITPVVDFTHIKNVLVITQVKEVPEDVKSVD